MGVFNPLDSQKSEKHVHKPLANYIPRTLAYQGLPFRTSRYVGHCSCEVPKRKRRKEMDEKDRGEAWAFFIRSIGRSPCRGCCMVLRLNCWCVESDVRIVFLSKKAAFQATSKVHPREFGIPGPKTSSFLHVVTSVPVSDCARFNGGSRLILSKKYEIIPSSKILFPFLIVQAGHCSCEVPPDKSETERDEKAPDEARKCEPAWNLTVVIQPSRLKG